MPAIRNEEKMYLRVNSQSHKTTREMEWSNINNSATCSGYDVLDFC